MPCGNHDRARRLTLPDRELEAECELTFRKASGNGGQKVNKTSVAVRLTHRPTGLTVTESGSRSQLENRHQALKKLRFALAVSCREEPVPLDTDDVPSLANDARYLPWLGILLDHLQAAEWSPAEAAASLGIARSRLDKLLRRDPRVLALARRNRPPSHAQSGEHETEVVDCGDEGGM